MSISLDYFRISEQYLVWLWVVTYFVPSYGISSMILVQLIFYSSLVQSEVNPGKISFVWALAIIRDQTVILVSEQLSFALFHYFTILD
jgi:hypothetical protein